MKRDYYLRSVNESKALSILDNLFSEHYVVKSEWISVYDSLNRIPLNSLYAKVSSPSYNASAMDGIATKSSITFDASETTPVTIPSNQFIEVNTGNVIPIEYDTVIMIEDVEFIEEGIKIIKTYAMFENIRPIGEDIVKGELVVPKYKKITPIMIGALLSAGITEIMVICKPKVCIIPTGDEIISAKQEVKDGDIIDSNSYFMKNELEILGAQVDVLPPQKDEYGILENTILSNSLKYDFLIIGAGSSAGSKDFTYQVLKQKGHLHVHGISIKPGKPSIIGEINQKIVLGIPGYPVSTYISFHLLVKHLMNRFTKQNKQVLRTIKAKLSRKVYSSLKNKEYIRVQLGTVNNELIATPLKRGAAIQMSLLKSDGLLIVDRSIEGYERNDMVSITLNESEIDTKKTLVSIGSHDIVLDLINDFMNEEGFNLASSHLGSFGGVLAIRNKESHISPIHILSEDGQYNKHIIKEYLNTNYVLIEGMKRKQGLYVKKGNPKNIQSIDDLKDSNYFVNRQKGSGTRILLDQLLSTNKINKDLVNGYNYELSTHTQVAVAVLSDRYDVGLGIQSVAERYDLDFIELAEESYDFLVHKDTLKLDSFNAFIDILKSEEFKLKISEYKGYKLDKPGNII